MLTNLPRQVTNQSTYTQIVIAAGESESALVELPSQCTPVCFFIPSNFSGSSITFQVQASDGSFVDLCDPSTGDAVTLTVATTPCALAVLPADLLALYTPFKIVSSTSQSTICSITVLGRTFL